MGALRPQWKAERRSPLPALAAAQARGLPWPTWIPKCTQGATPSRQPALGARARGLTATLHLVKPLWFGGCLVPRVHLTHAD